MFNPSKSTLLIKLKKRHEQDSFGTGFVYKCDSQHTWIITCAHNLNDMIPNTLQVKNESAYVVKSGNPSGFDVAILCVNDDLNTPSLELQHPSKHEAPVRIYGFSKDGKNIVFQNPEGTAKKHGQFVDDTIDGDGRARRLRIHLGEKEIQKLGLGNSGSPVIDETTGRVIGILRKAKGDGRSGTAIAVEALKKSFPEIFTDFISPPPEIISPPNATLRTKLLLLYAHQDWQDIKWIEKSLLDFIDQLAKEQNWELYWDEENKYAMWDGEKTKKLREADIVVSLISQPFIRANHAIQIKNKLKKDNEKNRRSLIVCLKLSEYFSELEEFIEILPQFPQDRSFLRRARNRDSTFAELCRFIQKWHKNNLGKVLPIGGLLDKRKPNEPNLLWKSRKAKVDGLPEDTIEQMREDACRHAELKVPDANVRGLICKAAENILQRQEQPLSKVQLEMLDREYLLPNSQRKNADAHDVRWVLRCAGLHPQASYK